jgi:hypothetical protein
MKSKKYIRFVLFCFAGLITSFVKAQDYTQDMQKIRESYKNSSGSFNMKYSYYPYDSINKATDSMHGTCTISGNLYYYNVSSGENSFEYIKNEKYYLVIDHPNKAIAIKYSSNKGENLWSIDKVDSLLNKPGIKVTYKSLGKEKGQYEVSCTKESTWNKLRIVFNKTNYTLREVWLYSDGKGKIQGEPYNKPRIGIFYSVFKGNIPDKNIFSEKRFVEDNGKGIVLTGEYKKYRLLNYLSQAKKS